MVILLRSRLLALPLLSFLFVFLAAGAAPTSAAENPARPVDGLPPRSMGGARVDGVEVPEATALEIDGEFNEAAWRLATPVTSFLQRDPKEGAPPSEQTEVRVLYDRAFLYIAVRALDREPARIVGIRTRRDDNSPSDWMSVFIDSYHDRRTAYQFAVNAAGVKQDTYWFADGSSDTSWDAVWDVSVRRDDGGWTAEFRIPFSQLRFEPGKRDTFGFAVEREIGRLKEISTWPLIARSKPGFVSQFGELGGLRLVGGARRLEIVPYTVAQLETQPVASGDPFQQRRDPAAAIGADIKYALTPGLTLTSTVNPDFGQVEADPAVVNLTAFETFYQERRPFFVEGSGNLRFDLDCNDGSCTGLFYSRRIGRQPHLSPAVPEGGFGSTPGLTTILGAAKVTGRAGAFSIGALNALAAQERASLAEGARRWNEPVEPFTNFAVGQAKREWGNQSSLGFMLTNTARRLTPGVTSLASSATTGGVNWDWRMGKGRYAVTGYWAGSTVRGSAEAIDDLQRNAVHNYQRPDAGYLEADPSRTSLNGHAGMVGFNKIGGSKVRFSFVGNYKTPGFDVNDAGYVRRSDAISESSWVQIRWDTPTTLYRNVRLNFNQWASWNFGGDTRAVGGNVNAHILLASNWGAGGGFNLEAAGIEDRATRGGPALRTKRGANGWAYVESDSRKALHGVAMGFAFRDERGASSYGLDPELAWRATSFLTVAGGAHVDRTNEDTQWVANVETGSSTHYVFGRIRQTTVGLTARVNYTITSTLTVQLYGQPFVSAGAYSDFKEVVRPRAARFDDQFAPYAYAGQPDFNYRSFRMTNVLRWEYKPGSTLYVVWQQGREGTASNGRFRYGRDLDSMFGLPATNVFLVKLSYWLNM